MDRVHKILIAIRNKGERIQFGGHLKEKGFDPILAGDGAGALEIALRERPFLIVTEIGLPLVETERLFHILRNNPYTSDIPFVFVGSSAVDIKGFRKGIDSLLVKPVKLDELTITISHHLTHKGREGIGAKEIEGRLSHIPLVDLLQILHLNRKEGVLRVFHEDKEGRVYLKGGIIYNAGIKDIEREKALYRLLTWEDGKFEFLPQPINIPPQIHRSPGNLLMEGMRQYDEWKKSKDQFPHAESTLQKGVGISVLPKGLKPIIYEIVSLVDIYPKIGDLVDHCQFPDYDVYRTLASLIRKGVLKETKGMDVKKMIPEELLTPSQALKLRERIAHKWGLANHGKVVILSTSVDPIVRFMDACKSIPGFAMDRYLPTVTSGERPLGEVGVLKIHGVIEIALLVLPVGKDMMPLWKAFLKGMIAVITLLDSVGVAGITDIAVVRDCLLSIEKVPLIYAFYTDGGVEERYFKKVLAIAGREPILRLDPGDRASVFRIFYALFGHLLKEGYQ